MKRLTVKWQIYLQCALGQQLIRCLLRVVAGTLRQTCRKAVRTSLAASEPTAEKEPANTITGDLQQQYGTRTRSDLISNVCRTLSNRLYSRSCNSGRQACSDLHSCWSSDQ